MEEIFEDLMLTSLFVFTKNNKTNSDLKIPIINLIITLSYFFIFIIVLLTLRYLRLSNMIIIPLNDLYNILPIIIIFIIILYCIKKNLFNILFLILKIKSHLWHITCLTLELIHIRLLKYNFYFIFMEKVYKISYIWISYVNHHPNLYIKYPRNTLRKILHFCYKKPYIFSLFIFLFFIIEILITKGIMYYTLYLTFIFLNLRLIIVFFNTFASYSWEKSCCIADYYHLKWDKPHYPKRFWLWFYTIRKQFNNKPEISITVQQMIDKNIKLIEHKRISENKITLKMTRKFQRIDSPFCIRLKVAYYKWSHIRWTHTTAIVSKIWHPMTPLFARNAIDFGALINNSWNHYHLIEKIKCKINYGEILYSNFENPFGNQKIKISRMLEHNLITNFSALHERQVKLSTYNKNTQTDTYNQSQDDIQIDPRTAVPPIIDGRTHALDQKAISNISNIREPASKIFSDISPIEYSEVLKIFRQGLLNNVEISPSLLEEIDTFLDRLASSCTQLKLHQIIWLEHLHLFPNNFIPPLRIPSNFCIQDLIPEVLQAYNESIQRLNAISNKLYEKEISCDYKEACEILNESCIQKILNEVEY